MGSRFRAAPRLQAALGALHERGSALFVRLWEGLSGVQGVRLYGPPPDASRTPTISITLSACPAEEAGRRLAERGIFASHGNFYAATVARRLGVGRDGLVRIGCACYSTEDEIERVIDAVLRNRGRALIDESGR